MQPLPSQIQDNEEYSLLQASKNGDPNWRKKISVNVLF
jgi:hypothetical protein